MHRPLYPGQIELMERVGWRALIQTCYLSCVVSLLAGCAVKVDNERKWYKGNLHTHSFWSDGDDYPEMIMDWYKSGGYHFVGLSDHNILASGEKWITVPRSRMYEDGFEEYLGKFGDDWVEYRVDSGRTHVSLKTYDEYEPLFEDENFLIIQSEEITDRFDGKPIHVNATNVSEIILPQGGTSVADVMQRNVDAVLRQREETGTPMFPHINHPNFYFAISAKDMIALRGERFFEVYNGHPMVHNYGDPTRPGTEELWDLINIAYRRRGQPLMFGLATDDSHNYHQYGSAYSNAGRGWVMVNSTSLSASGLINAMEEGNFYSSTGVTLSRCDFDRNIISIEVRPEPGVDYEIRFIGLTETDSVSRTLKTTPGSKATFDVLPGHLFVRAKIISTKFKSNPFREKDVEVAWTQPVMYNH